MTPRDAALVARAAEILERDSFGLRLVDILGTPVDVALKLSSEKMQESMDVILRRCMTKGLEFAHGSLELHGPPKARGWLTQMAATTTGMVSGVFGLASLPVELPILCMLILRAIVEVSVDYPSEDEHQRRLQCLFVLSLGGHLKNPEDKFLYWSVRDKFNPMLLEAGRGLVNASGAGVPIKALSTLVQRGIGNVTSQVMEQLVVRSVPVVSAVTGAALNFFLVNHYRKFAQAHFVLLHLERKYGRHLLYQHYANAPKKA